MGECLSPLIWKGCGRKRS